MKKTLLSVALILALSLGGAIAMAALSELQLEYFEEILDHEGSVNFMFSENFAGNATSEDFDASSDDLYEYFESADPITKIFARFSDDKDWTLNLFTLNQMVSADVVSSDTAVKADLFKEFTLQINGFPDPEEANFGDWKGWGGIFGANMNDNGDIDDQLEILIEAVSHDVKSFAWFDLVPTDFVGTKGKMVEQFFEALGDKADGYSATTFVFDEVWIWEESFFEFSDEFEPLVRFVLGDKVPEKLDWYDAKDKLIPESERDDELHVYSMGAELGKKAIVFNRSSETIGIYTVDFMADDELVNVIVLEPGDEYEFKKGSGSGGGCSATGFAPLAVLALLGMAIGKRK